MLIKNILKDNGQNSQELASKGHILSIADRDMSSSIKFNISINILK